MAEAAASARALRGTRLDRSFWLLFASSTLSFISIGAYAPVLPRFVRDVLGGNALEVGLVTGMAAIVAIAVRPWAGTFGDRRGRRLAALIGAAILAAGPALLLGPHVLALALLARLAVGVGDALHGIAAMAWVIDRAPPARRGFVLGAFGMSIWLGLGIGPQAGEALRGWGGYEAVWAWCAVMALLAGLLVVAVPRPPPGPGPAARAPGAGRVGLPRVPRAALLPGVVVALALYGEGVLGAFGVIHLVDRGVAPGAGFGGAASIFTVFAATTFVTRLAAGGLADRIGPRACAMVAMAVIACGWGVMALAATFAAAAAAAMLVGGGYSLLYPALALIVAERVDARDRGAGLGVYTACMDMGMGVGAIAGGLVVAATSTATTFWTAVGVTVVGLLVLRGDWSRDRGAGPREPAPALASHPPG